MEMKRGTKPLLLFSSSLTVVAGAVIAPVLPQMHQAFINEPHSALLTRLTLTLPALFIAIGAPFAGVLIDRFGRKPILLQAMALYAVSGISGYVLPDLTTILVGRALLGLAVSAIMTASTALIADYFNDADRQRLIGLQASFMALGGIVFITLSGVLADIHWRFSFLLYGIALLFIWPLFRVIVNRTAAAASHTESPESAGRLPRMKIFMIYGFIFIAMIVFYIIPVQLPFYLIDLADASNARVGIAIAVFFMAGALVSYNYRRIIDRLTFARIYWLALFLLAFGFTVIGLAVSYVMALVGLMIAGLGMGAIIPNTNLWLITLAPVALRGRVLGGLTTALFLGQFVSPIVTKPFIHHQRYGPLFLWAAAFISVLILMMTAGLYRINLKNNVKRLANMIPFKWAHFS